MRSLVSMLLAVLMTGILVAQEQTTEKGQTPNPPANKENTPKDKDDKASKEQKKASKEQDKASKEQDKASKEQKQEKADDKKADDKKAEDKKPEDKKAEQKQTPAEQTKGQISLADARSRIDQAIGSPKEMTAIMKQLSAEDQKQFLADVNKAIADMPASVEEKSAKYLSINRAALSGAAEGNTATLIAETFATVPPEALTIINERYALDLLSRSSDANVKITDEQFEQMSLELMAKIEERCAETDNADPRCAFAILMLVRASNGSPADLSEKLIDTLKTDAAKEMARNEWVPDALGREDHQQSYESLLASADAGRRPDFDFVLVIAGPQYGDSILHDLIGKNNDPQSFMSTRTPVLDAVENPLVQSTPIIGGQNQQTTVRPEGGGDIVVKKTEEGEIIVEPNQPGETEKFDPDPEPTPTPTPTPTPDPPEPPPYQWQTTH